MPTSAAAPAHRARTRWSGAICICSPIAVPIRRTSFLASTPLA